MAALLKLDTRPTAVVASNDLTAIGVLGAIHAAGLRVPQDVSVVGFDDIEISSYIQPPLTTVRVSRAEIATRAFSSLYAASHHGKTQGIETIVSAALMVRESTSAVDDKQRINTA